MGSYEDITCGHESIKGRHEVITGSHESLNCVLRVFNRWSLEIIVCYNNIMEVTRFDSYVTKIHIMVTRIYG
jgi:hypothetical protein